MGEGFNIKRIMTEDMMNRKWEKNCSCIYIKYK
jgi:hypothetical protein